MKAAENNTKPNDNDLLARLRAVAVDPAEVNRRRHEAEVAAALDVLQPLFDKASALADEADAIRDEHGTFLADVVQLPFAELRKRLPECVVPGSDQSTQTRLGLLERVARDAHEIVNVSAPLTTAFLRREVRLLKKIVQTSPQSALEIARATPANPSLPGGLAITVDGFHGNGFVGSGHGFGGTLVAVREHIANVRVLLAKIESGVGGDLAALAAAVKQEQATEQPAERSDVETYRELREAEKQWLPEPQDHTLTDFDVFNYDNTRRR
ncbi:MAG: hypothetical protein FJ253_08845 [Phycisphaerae bacterium]|nr:hypothetical protein [Phycisphaerae bacterium]